jgi:hypothetical protein
VDGNEDVAAEVAEVAAINLAITASSRVTNKANRPTAGKAAANRVDRDPDTQVRKVAKATIKETAKATTKANTKTRTMAIIRAHIRDRIAAAVGVQTATPAVRVGNSSHINNSNNSNSSNTSSPSSRCSNRFSNPAKHPAQSALPT